MFLVLSVGNIDANQIGLGSSAVRMYYPDTGTSTVVDNGITVVDTTYNNTTYGNMSGAFVHIKTGKQTGDSLSVSGLPSGFNSDYSSSSGILTITGTGTSAQYQSILRTLSFRTSSDNVGTTRVIQYILGHRFPHFDSSFSNSDTNFSSAGNVPHFYERLATGSNSRTAMATVYGYLGLQGYLLTLTSSTEYQYVTSRVGSEGPFWALLIIGVVMMATGDGWRVQRVLHYAPFPFLPQQPIIPIGIVVSRITLGTKIMRR